MQILNLPVWPYVYGSPTCTGVIRQQAEDFVVDEQLAFTPSGSGEHVFLQIEKTGENTEYIARQLARFAGVRQRDIGYAGLKDRHAVTTQWFSIWLPGAADKDPDWQLLSSEQIKILQAIRHARKLKRGVLAGNRFKIIVRDWQGDREATLHQLEQMKSNGIANYYGEQRFGHNGQNVSRALSLFQGGKVNREQRSLYLSAARSFLFNQILAHRVLENNWNQPLAGDVFVFDASHSCFKSTQPDAEIIRRVAAKEIHPTGVLWGRGDVDVAGDALAIEQAVINAYPELAQGLVSAGAERNRRGLRINVPDLQWSFISDTVLQLSFSLPAGSYATSLIREIIKM